MNAKAADDSSLKRLGGGRWQTRDERFTIEPQSGTWALVDAEQTDELGLPLVRGPFRSLTDAKAAIAEARTGGPAASPLEERLAEAKRRPATTGETAGTRRGAKKKRAGAHERSEPAEPEPPAWLGELAPAARARAEKLIAKLEAAGIADAATRVRADVVGGVPTVASTAIAHRVAELLAAAGVDDERVERLVLDVAELVTGDRDRGFDVEWRLVDGDGRPIELTARQIRALRR